MYDEIANSFGELELPSIQSCTLQETDDIFSSTIASSTSPKSKFNSKKKNVEAELLIK